MEYFSQGIFMLIVKPHHLVIFLFALLVIFAGAYFFKAEQTSETAEHSNVSDGPYVFVEPQGLSAHWLCNGNVEIEQLDEKNFPLTLSYCDLSASVFATQVPEQSTLVYKGDFPVAALSDFHGQYDLMFTLLTNNDIIDNKGNWTFGNGHFVITGDVFDRGDKVTEILWFLYQLEQQADAAGGKLHLLLGNHEVMVLNGDLRYLHPKYLVSADKLAIEYQQLYAKNSILGNWLRSKPVLVKINNMLFTHGGFHPDLAKDKRTIFDINQVFKANLVKAEMAKPREGFGKYLHKSNGPIWYRGYFEEKIADKGADYGASAAEIDLLLAHFSVDHIVVGHTSQERIEARHQGKVIAIDSSIKYGKYGEILFIDGDEKWRGTLSGGKELL